MRDCAMYFVEEFIEIARKNTDFVLTFDFDTLELNHRRKSHLSALTNEELAFPQSN